MRVSALLSPVALIAVTLFTAVSARGEVFHSKESALRTAFPEADAFASEALVLDEASAARIEDRARAKLPSRLANVHVAMSGGAIVGYAFIETHTVRSLPETILVAIHPDGSTRGVHLLAFHEPPEYRPPAKWLAQFEDKPLDNRLSMRRDISGIAGSTLTANSITAAVRRILATFEVAVAPAPASESVHARRR